MGSQISEHEPFFSGQNTCLILSDFASGMIDGIRGEG